jgi:hypothetical protein
LACPICQKRKPQRFCPALAQDICSVCCGTEREVTIDCHADCPHLIASRSYDFERRKFDWSKLPFADTKIPASFATGHPMLLRALGYEICVYARNNSLTVDTDVLASLQALAESYRTLSSGIYYERPPDYLLQRELYQGLKSAIEAYKNEVAHQGNLVGVRDSEIRDALIFFTQLGARFFNGRPKSRAYLDLLRNDFMREEFPKPESKIVLLP